MIEQTVEDGAILTTDSGVKLQCVGVRYQEEPDGTRHHYEYSFRSTDELELERKAAEEAERVARERAEENVPEVSPVVEDNSEIGADNSEEVAAAEKAAAESENSPEGSDEKTTQENTLPVN